MVLKELMWEVLGCCGNVEWEVLLFYNFVRMAEKVASSYAPGERLG